MSQLIVKELIWCISNWLFCQTNNCTCSCLKRSSIGLTWRSLTATSQVPKSARKPLINSRANFRFNSHVQRTEVTCKVLFVKGVMSRYENKSNSTSFHPQHIYGRILTKKKSSARDRPRSAIRYCGQHRKRILGCKERRLENPHQFLDMLYLDPA